MKLYFYKSDIDNFGDDLSPWLFERLLPGLLDDDESSRLIGLGTVLNNATPKADKVLVFGSGVGYGDKGDGMPVVDDTWEVFFVRGPLSAKAIGLDESVGITDGAILLRKYFDTQQSKKYKFGYMPHAINANEGWEILCKDMGYNYIDARAPIKEVIAEINDCECLLTEAMHGAITADALRVPWIPVHTGDFILPFKWNDWCASIDVKYEPVYFPGFLPTVWPPLKNGGVIAKTRRKIKDVMVQQFMRSVARKHKPYLSTDAKFNQLREQVDEKLEQLIVRIKEIKSEAKSH